MPLIKVLYDIPGLITYSSCQGDISNRSHIYFRMSESYFLEMLASLRRINARTIRDSWVLSQEYDSFDSGYRLTLWPHAILSLAKHLQKDFIDKL